MVAPACALFLMSLLLLTNSFTRDAPPPPRELATLQINLNTADEAQLRLLPGIGPALAERILNDRLTNGPFADLEDLTRVRGIGERTVLNIAPYVSVSHADETSGLHSPSDNTVGAAAGRE